VTATVAGVESLEAAAGVDEPPSAGAQMSAGKARSAPRISKDTLIQVFAQMEKSYAPD